MSLEAPVGLPSRTVPKTRVAGPLGLPAAPSSRSKQNLCSLQRKRLVRHTRQWQLAHLQGLVAPPACIMQGERLQPAGHAWRDRQSLPR